MSKNKPELRCVHRHSIKEHPNCFVAGNVDARVAKVLEDQTNTPWYLLPEYKIGYFDIETDGLVPDFGTMLSWAIKERGGANKFDVITKKELFDGKFDRRIVKSLIEEFSNYQILVGYFSTGFDLPFVRAKALHYDLDFPGYGSIYHFDIFYTVKSKLKLSRKSLENVCDYLHIEGKTPISKDMWRRAKYGDKEALKYVLDHNLGDTAILEILHNKLMPFRKWIKNSV